jgi:type IV pilus assembly protein PilM
MANRIVGIDIGRDSVRAVEVDGANKPRPTIVRYHEVAMPASAARAGEVLETHTVASAIRTLWSAGGFKSRNVVLGIGNQRVLARDLAVPKMGLARIRESLPFQVQDMLPMPVSEALLDFYPIAEGESENGPVINGLLVAAVKAAVLANVKAVTLAGLTPVEVDLIPFAISRVQTRGVTDGATVALVDVGAATTNVIVAIGSVPQFVRMIPAGGADASNAIATNLEVDEATAERAKRQLGLASGNLSPEQRAVVEHIYKATTDLVNSIRNTISYFDNTHAVPNVSRIVLSGGGARLNGFANALRELTRIDIVLADPFSTLAATKSVQELTPLERDTMTVALGLALGSAK